MSKIAQLLKPPSLPQRTQERYESFAKAYKSLIELRNQTKFSLLEKTAFVKRFEFTYELAWKLLKDLLEYEGTESPIKGSLDSIKESLRFGFIENFDVWLEMKDDRNLLAHEYGEDKMEDVFDKLKSLYLLELERVWKMVNNRYVWTK
jgi:nucleotidyltransferase substrate binding protein (TIGR01987 family)